MPRLRAWEGYSLEITLAPSFVRALFEKRGSSYVKIAGRSREAVIYQEDEWVVCEGCSGEELSFWSGLWLDRGLVEERAPLLAKAQKGLGLSVDPFDRHLIFTAVFLSRATNWEGNVLKWCRSIFSRAETLDDLLEFDFSRLGRSFQLAQLKRALVSYADAADFRDVWEARRKLLSIKNVGPKLVDAYLIFSGLDSNAAPIDRHALRMASRLGITGKPPRKSFCLRYPCPNCPLSEQCLRSRLAKLYHPVAGWVQTAFYFHDKTLCSTRACSNCTLSSSCKTISTTSAYANTRWRGEATTP